MIEVKCWGHSVGLQGFGPFRSLGFRGVFKTFQIEPAAALRLLVGCTPLDDDRLKAHLRGVPRHSSTL